MFSLLRPAGFHANSADQKQIRRFPHSESFFCCARIVLGACVAAGI